MIFLAELHFQIGLDWCEGAAYRRLAAVVQTALLQHNADVCQEANCTRFDLACLSDHDNSK